MSGVVDLINRKIGVDDISFGANSFVYVDVGGVPHRVSQVNAGSVPWLSKPDIKVEALVDGSKNLPVGASNVQVVNTSIFSGPVYGSGTTSGYIKNFASGLFQYGQSIATADIPSGLPATLIGSGTVTDQVFGYIYNLTSTAQVQIDALKTQLSTVGRLQQFESRDKPKLVFVGSGTAAVNANASAPALACMNGFPDVINTDQMVGGGIVDNVYRQVTAQTLLTLPNNLWGAEAASNWYAVFANAAVGSAELSAFTIKAMPYIRAKAEAGQVIDFGTNLDPNTATGYTFVTNEFVGGKIYVLTGAKAGQLREITANNNSAIAGTVSYVGAALALAQGDWFIILPPTLNFKWLGDFWNDSASNFSQIEDQVFGQGQYQFYTVGTSLWFCPFTWSKTLVDGSGAGGGGATAVQGAGGGGAAEHRKDLVHTVTAGILYTVVISGDQVSDATGSATYLGAILTLSGGLAGNSNAGGNAGGPYGGAGGDGNNAGYGGMGGGGIWGAGGPGGMNSVANGKQGGGFGAGGGGRGSGASAGSGTQGFLVLKKWNLSN